MSSNTSEIKRNAGTKFSELRTKRKGILNNFKEKLRSAKIEQIKNSLLNK